jgi:hypothetical protein
MSGSSTTSTPSKGTETMISKIRPSIVNSNTQGGTVGECVTIEEGTILWSQPDTALQTGGYKIMVNDNRSMFYDVVEGENGLSASIPMYLYPQQVGIPNPSLLPNFKR